MLTRNFLINFLKELNQNPVCVGGHKTLIGTDNAGIFYMLSYDGDGSRVGFGIASNIIKEIKEYPTSFILLIDATNDRMFIIPNGNIDVFLQSLEEKDGCYKIDMIKLKDDTKKINYEIDLMNFEEYIRSC